MEIESYADDSIFIGNGRLSLQIEEETSTILFKWFSNNCTVVNAHKYHLITTTSEEVSVKIKTPSKNNF